MVFNDGLSKSTMAAMADGITSTQIAGVFSIATRTSVMMKVTM